MTGFLVVLMGDGVVYPPGEGGGHLGIYWVGMRSPGLQLGSRSKNIFPKIDTPF